MRTEPFIMLLVIFGLVMECGTYPCFGDLAGTLNHSTRRKNWGSRISSPTQNCGKHYYQVYQILLSKRPLIPGPVDSSRSKPWDPLAFHGQEETKKPLVKCMESTLDEAILKLRSSGLIR